MKKTIFLCTTFLFTLIVNINCSNSAEQQSSTAASTATTNITKEPNYIAGEALVSSSDCATCHKPDVMLTGPSFIQIADKYAADTTSISTLAKTIIKGSTGKWGTSVMTAHPAISEADAAAMVKYIFYFKSK